ncbi:ABC transporter ATP-binding protein [Paenibacillus sp. GCM10023248]|uniref:ABC transporter ATP-binding protein n=1 Tax=Bacillales TaxID=1385 RepID=UPI00237884CD|nr:MULTISPECIES: ABC transporter ATP-binding protein [Bacillales]MDD9265741.1 ABC transporter ATP-binding protein [Paenibacillus sp. MAHUQ-63]MDR6878982.1 iron complex transport system ATP-binding protein [Bacillus sp. 3255]
MTSIIEMSNVWWQRDDKTILQGIDWHVNKGEHWAVLGLNGSGKTTILNMINGYMWPTQGQISVLGHPFGSVDLRDLRKRIGWVSSSLQEKLYASDRTQHVVISGKHASIGLYEKPSEADVEQARHWMQRLSCLHLYDRTYQSCSQGEKQKLLIARALMASPKLLILDEATNGLDFLSREALLASIDELAQGPDAPTLLFVTHHIEEILPVFSRSLLIRRGEVFARGLSRDVLTSAGLSAFFETEVEVNWRGERPWLSIPSSD